MSKNFEIEVRDKKRVVAAYVGEGAERQNVINVVRGETGWHVRNVEVALFDSLGNFADRVAIFNAVIAKTRNLDAQEDVAKDPRCKNVVFFGPDDRVFYLSSARYNNFNQLTSGILENGGWSLRIRNKGAWCGKHQLFELSTYSLLNVPSDMRTKDWEIVISWAERQPKKNRRQVTL